ncbi:MAG: PEGA domain-containing protein, partial [Verrucomicrobiota bacterium]
MNRETTKIDLPPPRMIQPRRRQPRWIWPLLIVAALGIGTGVGLFVGKRPGPEKPNETSSVNDQEVASKLAEARISIAEGEWFEARRLFEEVRQLDPENPDALASLPLIDRRLDEAKGSVQIVSEPAGATLEIEGLSKGTAPTILSGIPLGEHELLVSMPGYEPVVRNFTVSGEETLDLGTISLHRTAGQLEVVSEPKGAEFKLLKTIENDQVELVEVGSTPALIEKLDPGEYEILMAVEGWPEYSERVRVENNRNTSVSAIFAKGGVQILSDPIGAEVWRRKESGQFEKMGETPMNLADLPVGKQQFELRYADWTPIQRTVEVVDGATEMLEFAWERALVSFVSDPPGAAILRDGVRLGNGNEVTPFHLELPEGDYDFTAEHPRLGSVTASLYLSAEDGTQPVRFEFSYGSVTLTSSPSGAAVVANGRPLGRTPLTLPVVVPGDYVFRLSKEQYAASEVSGTVTPGGSLQISEILHLDAAPKTTRSFRNSIGQEMIWIGSLGGWVASTETTQEQYERVGGSNPSYFKAANHPVESVTWYDANKFCDGVTFQEKSLGNLPSGFRYRLPTDAEWSQYVGQQKLDGAISSLFDRKKSTAPVGSLPPNEFGLFDVRGNVWEWVSDWYSQTIVNRVSKEGATPVQE